MTYDMSDAEYAASCKQTHKYHKIKKQQKQITL